MRRAWNAGGSPACRSSARPVCVCVCVHSTTCPHARHISLERKEQVHGEARAPLLLPGIIPQEMMPPLPSASLYCRHSTQGAMLRAETSSPDNKPTCPDLVILWNGEADTQHSVTVAQMGLDGQASQHPHNVPCAHGMCVCRHTCTYTCRHTYGPASCSWLK